MESLLAFCCLTEVLDEYFRYRERNKLEHRLKKSKHLLRIS